MIKLNKYFEQILKTLVCETLFYFLEITDLYKCEPFSKVQPPFQEKKIPSKFVYLSLFGT